MRFQLVAPQPILADYVKSFWIMETDAGNEEPYHYHSMADGMPELIFQYGGVAERTVNGNTSRLPPSYIMGQSSIFSRQVCTGKSGFIGVYLYPFCIPKIFDALTPELNNTVTDLHTLLGKEGAALEEQVILARNDDQRVKIICDFLVKKIYAAGDKDEAMSSAIKFIIRTDGAHDIQLLAGKYNLSARQFERKFKEQSGFSPKLFSRIIRFQSALNQYSNKDLSLTSIAHKCGYYDQSHFIHDFKAFSGVHPKLYFSGKADGTELRANI